MTDTADQIAEGREAWARIRESGKRDFNDWILVAHALQIGRAASLAAARTNRAVGTTYNRAMSAWLREAGLGDVNNQERYRALQVLENLPAISAWRDGLPEERRARLNHPGAIWAHWNKTKKKEVCNMTTTPHRAERPMRRTTGTGGFRPIGFPQDMVRRVALAMRERWSNDTMQLARVALEAAFRNEIDVLECLPDAQPKPAPRSNGAALHSLVIPAACSMSAVPQ
jgi:hypothetical protein